MFDVPLPMRRAPREASTAAEDSPSEANVTASNTMAFSLMTKRGNRQQVWTTSKDPLFPRVTDILTDANY